MPLVPETAINGTFGELHDVATGRWLVEVQQVDARVMVEREEIRSAGKRGVGYKMKGVTGDGTIRMFHVISEMLTRVSAPMSFPRNRQFVGDLLVYLKDPEALGAQIVRLKACKFWEIPIGYNVNELCEDSIPFTFEDIEIVQGITGDPERPAA